MLNGVPMIKILVANYDDIIKSGLKVIKQKCIVHSFVNSDIDEKLVYEMIDKEDYSLIILEVNLQGADTESLVKNILYLKPEARILMLSIHDEEIFARKYLQEGVMGYISTSSSESEIKRAIDNVLNNRKYLSAPILKDLAHDIYSKKLTNPFERLTKRELQILGLVIKGKGEGEISNELDVEPSIIGTYKTRIFKKLECFSLTEINSLASVYNFAFQ